MNWPKRGEVQLEWGEELQSILIEAGTEGVAQAVLTRRFDGRATADELIFELEFLVNQNKVQKFTIRGRGRPRTVWRATTLILKP